jgi:hypothetical protein
VYRAVIGRSFCCVVSVCGPVYALVYPIVMGRLPVLCVCMWSRLRASVCHSDGPFFLLLCVLLRNVQCDVTCGN